MNDATLFERHFASHPGMVFVPLGYTEKTGLQFGLSEIQVCMRS